MKYDALLQVVSACDYRVVEERACGCQAAQIRCLLGRGEWATDRHEVSLADCLNCTKGGESGRTLDADPPNGEGDHGIKDDLSGPASADRGGGTADRGPLVPVVQESQIERSILRIEREISNIWQEVRGLSIARVPALEQQGAALWYNPFWDQTGPPPNFTMTGSILGCHSLAVPTCTVSVMDTGLTTTYGTAVTNSSGAYSMSGNVPTLGATYKVTIVPGDPYAARFASVTPLNKTINASNTQTATLTAATGKHCSNLVYFPLNATLTAVDSVIGTTTLTFAAGAWGNTITYNYTACAGCLSASGVPVTYSFASSSISSSYPLDTAQSPLPDCPGTTGSGVSTTFTLTLTGTSPFTASKTQSPGASIYCGASVTLTVHE